MPHTAGIASSFVQIPLDREYMKLSEKNKVQENIRRIESGEFTTDDVEMLFLRLRSYSFEYHVFREAGDFVAHSDKREKGIINDAMDGVFLKLRYFAEFSMDDKSLDVMGDLPKYFKRLLRQTLIRTSPDDLKRELGMSVEAAASVVENTIVEYKDRKVCRLKDGKLSARKLSVINYLSSFLHGGPIFDGDTLLQQILGVLERNKFAYSSEKILAQRSNILLTFCLLVHQVEFKLSNGGQGYCEIQVETSGDRMSAHGLLILRGISAVPTSKGTLNFAHHIFDTGIRAEDACSESLIVREERDGWVHHRFDLAKPLELIDGRLTELS